MKKKTEYSTGCRELNKMPQILHIGILLVNIPKLNLWRWQNYLVCQELEKETKVVFFSIESTITWKIRK